MSRKTGVMIRFDAIRVRSSVMIRSTTSSLVSSRFSSAAPSICMSIAIALEPVRHPVPRDSI